jgi:hypothetical protein
MGDKRILCLGTKLSVYVRVFREPFLILASFHAAGRCHFDEGLIEFDKVLRERVPRHPAHGFDTDSKLTSAVRYSPRTIPLTRREGYC